MMTRLAFAPISHTVLAFIMQTKLLFEHDTEATGYCVFTGKPGIGNPIPGQLLDAWQQFISKDLRPDGRHIQVRRR